MLSLFLSLAIALLAGAATAQAQRDVARPAASGHSVLAGRITVIAQQPLPVRRARVVLESDAIDAPRTTMADTDGRYRFAELPPGAYRVRAEKSGYVTLAYGARRFGDPGAPIAVNAGVTAVADISLPRGAAIEGQVVDESGEPRANLIVSAMRLAHKPYGRRPTAVRETRTDGTSSFSSLYGPRTSRVPNLPAGWALSGVFLDDTPITDAVTEFRQTPTPQALRVVVTSRLGSLAGKVTDADRRVAPGARVVVYSQDERLWMFRSRHVHSVLADAGGAFAVAGLLPGRYLACAIGELNEGDWFDPDVLRSLKPDQVRISGRPVEFDSAPLVGGPSPSDMRPDWTFEVRNLSGFCVVQADVASPDWALRRIMLDGRDVTDTVHDFREKDVEGLEVVLTKRASAVGGRVTDRDGRPIGNYSIVVFASDESRWKYPSRFIAMGRPNQDGGFLVRGLPPEDYLVVAIPPVQGTMWQDPEFLATLRGRATAVTLADGEKQTLDLKLLR